MYSPFSPAMSQPGARAEADRHTITRGGAQIRHGRARAESIYIHNNGYKEEDSHLEHGGLLRHGVVRAVLVEPAGARAEDEDAHEGRHAPRHVDHAGAREVDHPAAEQEVVLILQPGAGPAFGAPGPVGHRGVCVLGEKRQGTGT